jgi:hypothetical protein
VSGDLNIAALIIAKACNIRVRGGLAGSTGRAGPAVGLLNADNDQAAATQKVNAPGKTTTGR